jgi:hypothetical protein
MSILLSDWDIEKVLPIPDEKCGRCNCGVCDKVAKAAAIHAVQYLEGKCDGNHEISGDDVSAYLANPCRLNCPECQEKYHKELGI